MAFKPGLPFSKHKAPIYHTHLPLDVVNQSHDINSVIILLRNPVELFLRNFGYYYSRKLLEILAYNVDYDPDEVVRSVEMKPNVFNTITIKTALITINHVRNILRIYMQLRKKKLLVFYEDLISTPREIFQLF